MTTNSSKIFTSTALMILILSTGLMNHVTVIPLLLGQTGRDAWISVLVAFPPFLLWLGILYYITRKTNQQSLTLLIRQHFGKTAFLLIVIPLLLFLFAIAYITLKDTTNWISINYLPETPRFVITICILLLCTLMARAGITSISKMSAFTLPFVILFGFFVMFANMPHKHYSWVMPILQNGWEPIWKGCLYVAGGFVEILFLLLIQQHLKQKLKFIHFVILGLFLMGLTLGPLLGAITEFGPQLAAGQRYPAYEEWRLVKVGKYIEHVDFLAFFQWFSGAVTRIAVSLYLCVDVLNFKSDRMRNSTMWGISCVVLALVILPVSDIDFYEQVKNRYFPLFVPLILLISLLLLLCSQKIKQKRG